MAINAEIDVHLVPARSCPRVPDARWKTRTTRVRRAAAVPLLTILVCACGGGSGDAANNPSSPVPAPAPAPSPSPSPGPAPAPEPAPAPAPVVDSGVLATAICTTNQPVHAQPLVLAEVPGQPEKGLTTASQDCTAGAAAIYFLSSGGYSTPPVPYYALLGVRVDLLSRMQPLELGKFLTVTTREPGENSYELTSASTFVLPAQQVVATNRTLHEWTASLPSDPVVRLRLESRAPTADHPEPMFKVCWQAVLPGIKRSTCHVHDLADGTFRGLEIVDDSAGTGPLTWIGWR